jgi:hypothetical protein
MKKKPERRMIRTDALLVPTTNLAHLLVDFKPLGRCAVNSSQVEVSYKTV